MSDAISRRWLIIWSVLMLGVSFYVPAGTWTIDDAVKAASVRYGEGAWHTAIPDGEIRGKLSDPRANPILVPPFAEPAEHEVRVGFSPYARLFAGIESLLSRRALIVVSVLISLGAAWFLSAYGMQWVFLLLPLTFYGLVPWEHGLAMLLSLPAIAQVFLRERGSAQFAMLSGLLLATAIALRMEYVLLVPLLALALWRAERKREMLLLKAAVTVGLVVLISLCGPAEFFRQSALNHALPGWASLGGYLKSRIDAIWDLIFAMGPDLVQTIAMFVVLVMAFVLIGLRDASRVMRAAGWTGAFLFLLFALRVTWQPHSPALSLLSSGSLLFAMPWIALLVISRGAWKTKAMAYAIAGVVLGLLLVPVSSGVHWGPRLLLFAVPLLLIAFHQADLPKSRAMGVVILLMAVQTASSGALAFARLSETQQHAERLEQYSGNPMIATTRALAIDLYPLWDKIEFFSASTGDELKQILVEFYTQRRDSAWLHLEATDSLYVQTFPQNKPVWPHKMAIVNAGNLYRTQWRLYQLVMNRGDRAWIPLLEAEAARLMQTGETKRALFVQEDALALDTSRAEAHSNLGLLLARMGKTEEARAAVARALAMDSTLSQAAELSRQLEQVQADVSE
ncbi:MAG: hypothetical protein H6506_01525 [Calditrichaeota bacterium]|nr:hypothetical protein [Calditrichota bacterium]MCB9391311.1 hypothetical protein [Calditrichota bacterium]